MTNLLTVREIAKKLNVSEVWVRVLVRDGKLPALRLARRAIRFDEREVDQYLQGLKGKN